MEFEPMLTPREKSHRRDVQHSLPAPKHTLRDVHMARFLPLNMVFRFIC